MEFKRAQLADLSQIMPIFEAGIQRLREQGSQQWQAGYGPNETKIKQDIVNQALYILEADQIMAVVALIEGIDPVYTDIYDGNWIGEGPYISIHRVVISEKSAGKGLGKQILREAIKECLKRGIKDIRIDTHEKNTGMQKAILATGFVFRGYVCFPIPNGERKAYQWLLETNEAFKGNDDF